MISIPHALPELLKVALSDSLPGTTAHQLMAPLKHNLSNDYSLSTPRNSSVLILLYKKENQWWFPLIKRPDYQGPHGGQISFPGGKWEQEDASPWHTALRETREELGVQLPIEWLGALSKMYIARSNYMVYPHIGQLNETPFFYPDKREVEFILEVSLTKWLSSKHTHWFKRETGTQPIYAPYYKLNGHCVWGATAMMLSEFKQVMKNIIAS